MAIANTNQSGKIPLTKASSNFTISSHLPNIIEMIKNNMVSAISAQTGSGKTLSVPPALVNAGYTVRVALPNVVPTRSAYDYQRTHCHGISVGYAAAREVNYTDTDDLVYATTGHFVTKLIFLIKKAKTGFTSNMFRFLGDIFIVDEVHTGTIHITQLIGLLNFLKTHLKEEFKTRIVFTSATLNHLDVQRHFKKFPIYNVDVTRQYPIKQVFLKRERDPKNMKDDPTQDIIRIIYHECSEMKRLNEMWHIIVFRPGTQEVEDLVQALERQFSISELIPIPAYSDLSREDLNAIFEEYGTVKVIVGTNIIESSVTVDNVGAVINDGLVKRVYTNDTGGQKLVTDVISLAEGIQRAGRTARTRPGTVYHLYTKSYSEQMVSHHPPEIDRIPIHNVTLSCIDAGLSPMIILGITSQRQKLALDTLIEMGMVCPDPSGETLGTVTDAGDFVSHVNLGIHNAYLIYLALKHFQGEKGYKGDELVLRSAIALAVMLEAYGPPYYYIPRRSRSQTYSDYQTERATHITTYFERFMGQNELETLLKMYWIMVDEVYLLEKHSYKSIPKVVAQKQWAVANSMNNKKLREFHNTFRHVMDAVQNYLRRPDLLDEVAPPNDGELIEVIRLTMELFKLAYAKNRFTLIKGRTYEDEKHNTYGHATKHYCLDTRLPTNVIAAQVMEIQEDPSLPIRRIIGLTVPLN